MIKIEYSVNGVIKETYYKPNMALAKWLIKQLKETTHKVGKFKISKA
jgi:hypothetical protein